MSEEWEATTLGEVVDLQTGPAFKSGVFREALDGPRLLRGLNVGPDGTRWNEAFTWPESQLDPYQKYLLSASDVCLAMDATFTSDGRIRAVTISESDLPCLLVQRVARLRAKDNRVLLQAFLWLLIQSDVFRSHLTDRQTGAFAPHVSGKDISSFAMPLPPLPVQRRIVELMTHLDAHIANLQAERGAASATRDVLVESHFSSGSSSRYLVGDLLSIRTGKLDVNQGSDDGEYPFFTCSRVVHRIDWAEFYGEAVIIAGNGDLNVRYFEGDFNAYQRTYVLQQLDGVECNLKYLYLFFDFYVSTLRSNSSGSVIKYIKLGDLRDALVPLPTSQEQQEFVSVIFGADEVIGTLDQEIAAMASLRVRLLDGLLRGTDSILSQYDTILEQVA
jgi:restriction endonuclease S subunit